MRLLGFLVGPTLVAGAALAGCGNSPPRSAERFCGELRAHATEIQTPPSKADEIPAFITLFSKMGEVAPLEVQRDWETFYGILKTANTVNAADPASQQAVADNARGSQQAIDNVVAWAKTTCGLDLGPVGVVSGGAPIETTTTTAVPTTTS